MRRLLKISHPAVQRIIKMELYEELKKSVLSATTLTESSELSIEHYVEAHSAEQSKKMIMIRFFRLLATLLGSILH